MKWRQFINETEYKEQLLAKINCLKRSAKKLFPNVARGSLRKLLYTINYEISIIFLIFANFKHQQWYFSQIILKMVNMTWIVRRKNNQITELTFFQRQKGHEIKCLPFLHDSKLLQLIQFTHFLTRTVLREKKEQGYSYFVGRQISYDFSKNLSNLYHCYLTASVQIKPQDFSLASLYFFIIESA